MKKGHHIKRREKGIENLPLSSAFIYLVLYLHVFPDNGPAQCTLCFLIVLPVAGSADGVYVCIESHCELIFFCELKSILAVQSCSGSHDSV